MINKDSSDKSAVETKRLHRPAVLALVIIVPLLIVAGSIFIFNSQNSAAVAISPEIISKADFPVYVPTSLPDGYAYESNSAKLTGGVLTYSLLHTESGSRITLTSQSTPKGFDMSKMTGDGSGTSRTVVSSGTMYDLSTGDSSKFILDRGEVLVYIASSRKIDTAMVRDLIDDLVKVD